MGKVKKPAGYYKYKLGLTEKRATPKQTAKNRKYVNKDLTVTSKQIMNFLNKYNKEAVAAGRKNKPISDNKLQHTKDFLNMAEFQTFQVKQALTVMKDFPSAIKNAFIKKFSK